jgi:hypothetical protein
MIPFAQIPAPPPMVYDVTPRQQEILNKIYNPSDQIPKTRRFGSCSYDWGGWKLIKDVRVTERTCGSNPTQRIAVSCQTLKTNILSDNKWAGWISPIDKSALRGEDMMVAALCANITN